MEIFRTNSFDVYRFTRSGNSDEYGASPVYEGLDCQVTPASSEIIAIHGGSQGYQLHEVYFVEDFTLKIGDKLQDASRELIVRENPERYDVPGTFYTRVLCEEVVDA